MKSNKYLIIGITMIIIMSAVVTGCGASDSGKTSAQTPAPSAADTSGNEVIMQDHTFIPAEITIKKGESVTWTNKDSAAHDVTSATFKSDLLSKGQSFEQVFNDVGTFEYSCTPHPYMKGKVIVTE